MGGGGPARQPPGPLHRKVVVDPRAGQLGGGDVEHDRALGGQGGVGALALVEVLGGGAGFVRGVDALRRLLQQLIPHGLAQAGDAEQVAMLRLAHAGQQVLGVFIAGIDDDPHQGAAHVAGPSFAIVLLQRGFDLIGDVGRAYQPTLHNDCSDCFKAFRCARACWRRCKRAAVSPPFGRSAIAQRPRQGRWAPA